MPLLRRSTAVIAAIIARGACGAIACVLAPLLWLWHGIVWSRRVLFFEDISAYFVPLWTATARALRQGRLPAWELGAFSGQPLLGDPQIGIFYPPHWLGLLVSPVRAYSLSIVAHDLLAAAGAYGLCRALGRSRPASATAAIALSLSAYFVLEARHEMFIVSAAWVPCLLWAITCWSRHARPRALVAIAGSFAMSLLGGGWSMLVFAAPVVAIFTLARTRAPARLLGVAAGLTLGLGLAAVQLLPALAHAQLSPRALPLAESFAGSYAWPSLRYAITLLFPQWYGDAARHTYRGAPDHWELCGYGVGLVAALCAIASLRGRVRRRETLTYLGLVALAALAALGPHGPLWRLTSALPIVGHTRCPARALFAYTLVAPILCAAGVDHLRAWAPRRWRRLAWALPLLVAAELLVSFRAQNPTLPIAQARVTAEGVGRLPLAPTPGPLGGRTIIDVHLGQRFHNAGLSWNLEIAGGYSSLPLWRYLHLLWIANHGHTYPGWPHPALADDLSAQGLWIYGSPLVDLLNVRWALLPHNRDADAHGWQRVEVGADGIDLWTNDEALPRAFVLHRARRVPDEAAAAEALADATFDPAREVIVEEDLGLSAEGGPRDPASLLERHGDRSRYAVSLATDGVLVIAEPHEPSWGAEIDGRPAPVLRVDYALLGLRVPAGDHLVALARRDRPLRTGATISALALLTCLALAWRRRGPRP